MQCEQPVSNEVGIRPALMFASTASESRTLGLFPQYGAQAPPDEAVHLFKGEGMRLFEVAKPAPQ
jgi:hypothetical protein